MIWKGCETMPDMEAVISEIVEHIEATLAVDSEYVTIPLDLLQYALALLKEQGTKTGKWIEQEGCDGDVYYDCSVCGESWVTIEGTPQENGMLYCPHCGAKMEGR